MSHIKNFSILGCKIAAFTIDEMLDAVINQSRRNSGGYVCFTNVHVAIMAREDTTFKDIVNDSFLSVPDGKPIYWAGRIKGNKDIEQTPGPDFFPKLLSVASSPPLKHYFYGGSQEVLDILVEKVKLNYPDAEIVGAESPPFRELSNEEIEASLNRICGAKPNFVWVGLGAPKQELWMAMHWQELKPAILFGVGAAFDFHAETVQRTPRWAQRLGLEWLHRLLQEPGRLWKRYFYTNSAFLFYLLKDALFKK